MRKIRLAAFVGASMPQVEYAEGMRDENFIEKDRESSKSKRIGYLKVFNPPSVM